MKPRALIVGDRRKPGVEEGVRAATPFLRSRLDVEQVDPDVFDLSTAKADLILVFGGDGSLLYVARHLGSNPIPVLGVNHGRFGWLAELQPDELEKGVDAFVRGEATIAERARLRCAVRAGGTVRGEALALNDAVVGRRTLGRMVDVEVRIDGRDAIAVAGDGLIVATPSGSTAHALSAGGPILEPTLPAMVLVPICPHALTNRPVIVPLSSRVELRVRPDRERAVVTFDGQEPVDLGPDDVVTVEDAHSPLRLVAVGGRSYFDALRLKFGWAGRPNYRAGAAPAGRDGPAGSPPAAKPPASSPVERANPKASGRASRRGK